ncbi:MAG: DNA polymerase III subunit delta [Bacteroidales bacterium]|nr:DNA polymerase III subunit delta [Bacteroidales bacterium]
MQFKDIIGQRFLINQLTEIIDSGRVSHAQLFLGKNGYGSLALAIAYAQYLSCSNRQHYAEGDLRADSCGECPNCRKFAELAHPDLHLYFPTANVGNSADKVTSNTFYPDFVKYLAECRHYPTPEGWMSYIGAEAKKGSINVNDAAEFIRLLSLKPYEAGYKMFVIWMAEFMKEDANGAAQRLLKAIEEPPENTLILLVAESGERIPATILSRVQAIRVGRIDPLSLGNALRQCCGQASDSDIERAVDASEGSYTAAVESLFSNETQRQCQGLFVEWMRMLARLNMKQLAAWVETVCELGREQQRQFLLYAQDALRACYLRSAAGYTVPGGLDFGDERFTAAFPAMVTTRNIEAFDKAFSDAIYAIDRNAYGKITFMQLSFTVSSLLRKR